MNYIKTKIFSFLLIAAVFAVVVYTSVLGNNRRRYVLFFKNSLNSKIETEIRYLPVQNIKSEEQAFMEDLMLGPVNHDHYRFAEPGTELRSCFLRNGVLYIDFPGKVMDAFTPDFGADDLALLLRKNIFTNFKNIDKVSVYINGKEIYELSKK